MNLKTVTGVSSVLQRNINSFRIPGIICELLEVYTTTRFDLQVFHGREAAKNEH
jgi:hypothetical protein